MPRCRVRFTQSRLGPSAMLLDARGRSINVINYDKGTVLTEREKKRARDLLMKDCRSLSSRREAFEGTPGGSSMPWLLAAGAAVVAALAVFEGGRTYTPTPL